MTLEASAGSDGGRRSWWSCGQVRGVWIDPARQGTAALGRSRRAAKGSRERGSPAGRRDQTAASDNRKLGHRSGGERPAPARGEGVSAAGMGAESW